MSFSNPLNAVTTTGTTIGVSPLTTGLGSILTSASVLPAPSTLTIEPLPQALLAASVVVFASAAELTLHVGTAPGVNFMFGEKSTRVRSALGG